MGNGLVFTESATPLPQEGGATALHNLGSSLPLDQPRNFTCTNASRGLLATAEFLVFTINCILKCF